MILCCVQIFRGLNPGTQHILGMYSRYRSNVEKKLGTTANPKRIIFYRGEFHYDCISLSELKLRSDGVSEGQFKQVLEQELPLLKS